MFLPTKWVCGEASLTHSNYIKRAYINYPSHQFLSFSCLHSITVYRRVASLAIFYRCFHGYCLLSLQRTHYRSLTIYSHPCTIYLTDARINQYLPTRSSYSLVDYGTLFYHVFPPFCDLDLEYQGVSVTRLTTPFLKLIFILFSERRFTDFLPK